MLNLFYETKNDKRVTRIMIITIIIIIIVVFFVKIKYRILMTKCTIIVISLIVMIMKIFIIDNETD